MLDWVVLVIWIISGIIIMIAILTIIMIIQFETGDKFIKYSFPNLKNLTEKQMKALDKMYEAECDFTEEEE